MQALYDCLLRRIIAPEASKPSHSLCICALSEVADEQPVPECSAAALHFYVKEHMLKKQGLGSLFCKCVLSRPPWLQGRLERSP